MYFFIVVIIYFSLDIKRHEEYIHILKIKIVILKIKDVHILKIKIRF